MTPLTDLAARFQFNSDKMISMVTSDLRGDDWMHRTGEGNHAQWLLGHLAATRRWMLRMVGAEIPVADWEQHFGAGDRASPESDAIPPEDLKREYINSGRDVVRVLSQMTAAQADAPTDKPFPDGSTTVGGMLHFLHFHEAYHLGQLGLIRRALGKPGMV